MTREPDFHDLAAAIAVSVGAHASVLDREALFAARCAAHEAAFEAALCAMKIGIKWEFAKIDKEIRANLVWIPLRS
jgi:hypothetical protein